ncbi:5017_t:CDS:2, partial [Ambispora gerdemannii]
WEHWLWFPSVQSSGWWIANVADDMAIALGRRGSQFVTLLQQGCLAEGHNSVKQVYRRFLIEASTGGPTGEETLSYLRCLQFNGGPSVNQVLTYGLVCRLLFPVPSRLTANFD